MANTDSELIYEAYINEASVRSLKDFEDEDIPAEDAETLDTVGKIKEYIEENA